MHIEFYGATSGITGSCHILRANDQLVLLDCGLIQGKREVEARNREPFPFSPNKVSAVVLSHGHIDHSGRIPLLIRQGYRGPIYAQNATCDLCKIMLQDSASLQERDAEYENKWRDRKKKPLIEALYTIEDARKSLESFTGLRYREKREILPGIYICFQDAGHILGSSSVEVWIEEEGREQKIVFSGDLGQYDTPILNDPAIIQSADHVLVESTYGNRRHRNQQETIDEIGNIISMARHESGNLLIPAFSIGRSQEILYYMGTYYKEWELNRWKVFLDSPMAIKASKVYWEYPHLYDEDATRLRHRINEMPQLKNLHQCSAVEDSMAINNIKTGAIIIAGSGMCNGGRIIHHLKQNISRKGAHIMIVGYQANGTLGRKLVDGHEQVKIHGILYPVHAQIHTVGGLSAHGDVDDLTRWIRNFNSDPFIHIVHGEKQTKQEFCNHIHQSLGLRVDVPLEGDILEL